MTDQPAKTTCRQCILHSGMPDVVIREDGLCTQCADYGDNTRGETVAARFFQNKFNRLLMEVKKGKRPYDALVLFSGGKDSTRLLKIVKEDYGLKPLAFSVVHPLVNRTASGNMDDIAKKLDVTLLKYYLVEHEYKSIMRYAMLYGEKYGLNEFVGCSVCSFLFKWVAVRYAFHLGIPIVFDGTDIAQSDGPYYLDGEKVGLDLSRGVKPFGRLHDLVGDALGDAVEGSIYDCDPEVMQKGSFPNIIAPFTFISYHFSESYKEIAGLGLNEKNFRKLFTNCNAIPFFSYFTIKKFDCVPYARHYANEVRRGYSNLLQLKLDPSAQDRLSKELVERMMEEYKKIILYVVEHKIDEQSLRPEDLQAMREVAPTYRQIMGEEVCDVLLKDVLMINEYARFFDIDTLQLS